MTKGWTGSVSFFKNENLGTCAFIENNIKLSGGAARILKDGANKDVNGKITLINTAGSQESGFLFPVKWFDNEFIRELECANPKFSKDIERNTIALANRIDKS